MAHRDRMGEKEMADAESNESDHINRNVQQGRKNILPSLSWKQRVIGFGITAGLAALFSILVSHYVYVRVQTSEVQCTNTQLASLATTPPLSVFAALSHTLFLPHNTHNALTSL